jgi:hypothetical protein
MFPWGKLGDDGRADGHARAIAWGQSSRDTDYGIMLSHLNGIEVCAHLELLGRACDDCAEEAIEALSESAQAEYEVIRLDTTSPVTPVEDQLHEKLAHYAAEYDRAERDAKAAEERLNEVKAGIKASAQLLRPGAKAIRIVSDDLAADLTVTKTVRNTVDTKLLRRLCDQTGVAYSTLTKAGTSWTLRRAK